VPRSSSPNSQSFPKYRNHKPTGQAVVTIRLAEGVRRDIYLDKHDSPESRVEYAKIIKDIATGTPIAKATPTAAREERFAELRQKRKSKLQPSQKYRRKAASKLVFRGECANGFKSYRRHFDQLFLVARGIPGLNRHLSHQCVLSLAVVDEVNRGLSASGRSNLSQI
jgi:hypothetical protein